MNFFCCCKITSQNDPSPSYEVPIYLIFCPFSVRKKDDFEGGLKGVDGCFKLLRVFGGCCRVFEVRLKGV